MQLEKLFAAMPALANEGTRSVKTSTRYEFIGVKDLITELYAQGFEATLQGNRKRYKVSKDLPNTAKFAIILEGKGDEYVLNEHGDRLTVAIASSHDGTSRFTLAYGINVRVCTNGLVLGEKFGNQTIKHIGQNAQEFAKQIKQNALEKVFEVKKIYQKMVETKLSEHQMVEFAEKVLTLRGLPVTENNIGASLKPEFELQSGDSVFDVMNRIQGHMVRGSGLLTAKGRKARSMVKGDTVTNVDSYLQSNAMLMDYAMEYLM